MKAKSKLLFALLVAISSTNKGQTTIAVQNFDGNSPEWSYSSNVGFFSSTSNNNIYPDPAGWGIDGFFGIIKMTEAGRNLDYSNLKDSILGLNDLNDEGDNGTSGYAKISFSEIDVSSFSAVEVTFDYDNNGFDGSDYLIYTLYEDGIVTDSTVIGNSGSTEGTITISVHDTTNSIQLFIYMKQDGSTDFAGLDNFKVAEKSTKLHPSNHLNNFRVDSLSWKSIFLNWTENDGDTVPDGYLIKVTEGVDSITSPVDGTDPNDDLELTDGSANIKVSHGDTAYTLKNCKAQRRYYFKIYPFTNSGEEILFKTDGVVPGYDSTTDAIPIQPVIWLNELHYDNDGSDVEETIEVVLKDAIDYTLSDFTINLYNGSDGIFYDSKTLDNFTIGNTSGDYTFFSWSPVSIQNGSPDGVSISYRDTLIIRQLLSYEGIFLATNGPANDETSEDIGITENGSSNSGYSLQLQGIGSTYEDFTWKERNNNPGALNTHQLIGIKWLGGTSSDWDTNANWEGGSVPDSTNNVGIDSGVVHMPVLYSSNSVNDLLIMPTASLKINAGKTFTVNNLYILSPEDEGKTGAIVPAGILTINGTAYVERFITRDRWWYITTPVTGDFSSIFNAVRDSNYLYTYDEPEDTWSAIDNDSVELSPMTGYAVFLKTNDSILVFEGNLVTGEQSIVLDTIGKNWNLLGNPFTFPVDWDNIYHDSAFNGLYVRTNGNYATYINGVSANGGSNIISGMQAFWVFSGQEENGIDTIKISTEDWASNDTLGTLLKSNNLKHRIFSLVASTNGFNDETVLRFTDKATNAFDKPFDAFKYFVESVFPQIYTYDESGNKLVINSMNLRDSMIIKIGFIANSSGTFTMYQNQNLNMNELFEIILIDNVTGISTNMLNDTYTFSAQKGDYPDRFDIMIMRLDKEVEEEEEEEIESEIKMEEDSIITSIDLNNSDISVYSASNKVYILNKAGVTIVQVRIYTILGKQVLNEKILLNELNILNLRQPAGYYFLQLSSETFHITKKIFIN
ncbi:T9SS type A sorting domain-containing protein [Bacteroidota bacterium]